VGGVVQEKRKSGFGMMGGESPLLVTAPLRYFPARECVYRQARRRGPGASGDARISGVVGEAKTHVFECWVVIGWLRRHLVSVGGSERKCEEEGERREERGERSVDVCLDEGESEKREISMRMNGMDMEGMEWMVMDVGCGQNWSSYDHIGIGIGMGIKIWDVS